MANWTELRARVTRARRGGVVDALKGPLMSATPYAATVQRILSKADVRVIRDSNGGGTYTGDARPWDIRVADARFFRRVLFGGSLALGEAYMDGWWSCDDVVELVRRLKS